MECYGVTREQLLAQRRFPVTVVRDCAALDDLAARRIADLLVRNNERGTETAVILPVGPLQYGPLADRCNRERIPLKKLVLFMMDEYLGSDDAPIDPGHPLSFKGFMMRSFVSRLDPERGFSAGRLVFPVPSEAEAISRRILSRGGADLCFAGVGISGHIAFNDPPEPGEKEKDLRWMRQCSTRVVTLSRESGAQMAMGGTHGNWSIIPRLACTLGMKELLASKRVCLLGMRAWHAGTVRRALFGPVTASWPASLLQEHPALEAVLTEQAARTPVVNVTLDTGEEDREP